MHSWDTTPAHRFSLKAIFQPPQSFSSWVLCIRKSASRSSSHCSIHSPHCQRHNSLFLCEVGLGKPQAQHNQPFSLPHFGHIFRCILSYICQDKRVQLPSSCYPTTCSFTLAVIPCLHLSHWFCSSVSTSLEGALSCNVSFSPDSWYPSENLLFTVPYLDICVHHT